MTEKKPTLEYGTRPRSIKRAVWISLTISLSLCAATIALVAQQRAARLARQRFTEQQKRHAEQAPVVGGLHNKYDPMFQQDLKEPAD